MPSTKGSPFLLEHLSLRLRQWAPSRPWVVAYSGGRDSTVLLWALVRSVGPAEVTAVHVDHGWRSSSERQAESEHVAAFCRSLGVSLVSFGPPSSAPGSEADARRYRYGCFARFLEDWPQASFFLAHHADDQAETILMRLLQGRSWQGLGGIPERRGPFHRPFLDVPSAALAAVAAAEGLVFFEDSTNAGDGPARNYLRHQVFPRISSRFPGAVGALTGFGRAWRTVEPDGTPDGGWRWSGSAATIDASLWDAWNPLVRQAQLLAVVARRGGPRLSRKLAEAAAQNGRVSAVEGSRWRWSRTRTEVRWERVVQPPAKEYFIQIETGRLYVWEDTAMRWTTEPVPGSAAVPAIDSTRPWVCRSAASGARFASSSDPDWGKAKRRSRLGGLGPDRVVLVLQDGLIRAVLDRKRGSVVWLDAPAGKLHNSRIFVTLERRSEYERR